jgi:hypothetical protein
MTGTWSRSGLRAIDEGCTMNRLFQSRAAAMLLVASSAAGLLGPSTAGAGVPPVTTFTELATAFNNGGTVVLGNDITSPGQALAVDELNVTLDLAGHSLSITGVPAGHAAIGVPLGASLTIVDATGAGSITAVGGAGGAGVGGGAGTAASSVFNETSRDTPGTAGADGTVTGGNGLPGLISGTFGTGGADGGAGGAVAGTAPGATGGDGASGGGGGAQASGGSGGNGGGASTTGTGGVAQGGDGGDGGTGGAGAGPGGHGGFGGNARSSTGVGTGGTGGDGGDGGSGARGGSGNSTGPVTILGGTVTATGGVRGAGIGGGAGGLSTIGFGGGGGGGGTITIAGATVIATAGPSFVGIALCARAAVSPARAEALVPTCGPRGADIGGGAGGRGGPGGSQAGTNGGNGFGGLGAAAAAGGAGADGAQGTNGNVRYGPGAPMAVSALAEDVSARVSFDAPADPGTDAITSYTVTATDTTDSSGGGQHVSGPAGPLTVEGLTTGDDYTFTVKATNGAGTGLASAPSSAVTAEDIATTTGLASSASRSAPGESVTFTATVAPAPDGGTVAFEIDGTGVTGCAASAVDSVSGEATCDVSSLAAGTHSVVATYGGNTFYAGSESTALDQVVKAPDPIPTPTTTSPATTPATVTPFPSDATIVAGLETVGPVTLNLRALSFTQGIVTKGTISWRLDLSFYLPKKKADRRAAQRKPIRLASGGSTTATPATITHTIRLGARARAQLKRHPRARLVLRTTLHLPKGRTLHATKTLFRGRL